MMILIHILIAFSSIFYTGFTFLFPSKQKLKIAYFLVASTLITGSYLLLTMPSHMVQTCITGLIYLGFVTLGIVLTQKKLAKKILE